MRAAEDAGRNVQEGLDQLVNQLQKGNMNPGIGTKHLFKDIFEARARIGSDITRVLFFFYVDKRIIATHGFVKKTQKTPPAEIARAKSHRTAFIEKEARKHENA